MASVNFRVAERALAMWNDPVFVNRVLHFRAEVYPLVVPACLRDGRRQPVQPERHTRGGERGGQGPVSHARAGERVNRRQAAHLRGP